MSRAAINTLLQVEDAPSAGTYTTIVGVSSISGPDRSTTVVPDTSHSSLKPIQTKVPTLLMPGKISFTVFWDPADPTHDHETGLYYLWRNRVKDRKFRLVTPEGDVTQTYDLGAFISALGEAYPVDGLMTSNCTLELSGDTTYTVV
jgi:hypothetical protein